MLSSISRAAFRRAGIGRSHPPSVRVCELTWQFQRISIAQSSYDVQTTCARQLTSWRRSYATATKSAHKLTTSKKVSATKKTSKAKKVPAKPKSKPKKKAAKPRVLVKDLTEEQKTKRAELKKKQNIKDSKAAALLSPPKKLPATAWSVFLSENIKEERSQAGESFKGSPAVASGAATKYRNLSSSEREHYNHVSIQNKQANEAAYQSWVASFTPDQIAAANVARTRLKRLEGRAFSQKYPKIQDPRLPKRGGTARGLFTVDRWASGDLKGITIADASKAISAEWNDLSAAEKKRYEDLAAEDSARYKKESQAVFKQI